MYDAAEQNIKQAALKSAPQNLQAGGNLVPRTEVEHGHESESDCEYRRVRFRGWDIAPCMLNLIS